MVEGLRGRGGVEVRVGVKRHRFECFCDVNVVKVLRSLALGIGSEQLELSREVLVLLFVRHALWRYLTTQILLFFCFLFSCSWFS